MADCAKLVCTDSVDNWTMVNSPETNSDAITDKSSAERDEDGVAVIAKEENTETDTPEIMETVTSTSYNETLDYSERFPIDDEALSDDFYAQNPKIKSYVHKRNERVGGVLNTAMLWAIVAATALAAGHVWGTLDAPLCAPLTTKLLNHVDNLTNLEIPAVVSQPISSTPDSSLINMQPIVSSIKTVEPKKLIKEPEYIKNTELKRKFDNPKKLKSFINGEQTYKKYKYEQKEYLNKNEKYDQFEKREKREYKNDKYKNYDKEYKRSEKSKYSDSSKYEKKKNGKGQYRKKS